MNCILLFICLLELVHSVWPPPPAQPFRIENVKFSKTPRNKTHRIRPKRQLNLAANVTHLLNSILEDYDKHFRPDFNTPERTKVYIDFVVRTMGPVSELTDTYSFNCYFRQRWRDKRLRFNAAGSQKQLSLSMAMLDKIWKPDTYFWNGAASYIHTMTNSNRLVRLSPDGTVLFSSRITIKGRCQMSMTRYPLDKQACRLIIGSYAYSSDELEYEWTKLGGDREKGVQMDEEGIRDLPQFSVTGCEVFDAINMTRDLDRPRNSLSVNTGNYSALEVRFYFDRHFGYFLMNFYVPCTLVVLLCWVAFWTNREATGDRMGIGITSVLTMVFIANDSKTDSPKVDFPTALDIYIWICYTTLLICMVEFTVVHCYTKFNTGDPEIQQLEREKMRQIIRSIPRKAVMSSRSYNRPGTLTQRHAPPRRTISTVERGSVFSRRDGGRHSMMHRTKKLSFHIENKRVLRPSLTTGFEKQATISEEGSEMDSMEEFQRDNVGWRLYYWMMDHGKSTDPFGLEENSISSVDKVARVALPVIFLAIIIIYYNFYVNTPFEFIFEDSFETHAML